MGRCKRGVARALVAVIGGSIPAGRDAGRGWTFGHSASESLIRYFWSVQGEEGNNPGRRSRAWTRVGRVGPWRGAASLHPGSGLQVYAALALHGGSSLWAGSEPKWRLSFAWDLE